MKYFAPSLLILFTSTLFFSCQKDIQKTDDLFSEVVAEDATIILSQEGFTTTSNGLLKATDASYYEAGTMDYVVNGTTEASFEFNSGGEGQLTMSGNKSIKNLKGKSKKNIYHKVIVSPIVKVKGCDYIVQGIIEFYDDNKTLLATIDFGDGTCDEWAIKSFPNNSKPDYTFSQKDFYKK